MGGLKQQIPWGTNGFKLKCHPLYYTAKATISNSAYFAVLKKSHFALPLLSPVTGHSLRKQGCATQHKHRSEAEDQRQQAKIDLG